MDQTLLCTKLWGKHIHQNDNIHLRTTYALVSKEVCEKCQHVEERERERELGPIKKMVHI